MDTELKHCPFCGGDADILDIDDGLAWNGYWSISCLDCEAEIQRHYLLNPTDHHSKVGRDKKKARVEIVKVWNKRFRGRKK